MANTFLNTGRTVVATNNPQNNIKQVDPNTVPNVDESQPITNVPQNNQQQTNTINPITIPIQIQPQIANQSQQQNNQAQQPSINKLEMSNQNTAPIPQNYQNSNTPNTTVDFNQIYSSHQNNFGNTQNNTNYSSGIKKTSIGTTIVTPTAANLNSVEGQYQSAYSDTINSLISEMLNQMNSGFQYDPNSDNSLKIASEYASNSTLQSLAGSGVLNSSSTAERVARIVSELVPQYEEKAHGRWLEHLEQLANTAQIVMTYDNQQFSYWKDAKDREFENKQFEYKKQQDNLTNAWKRVDELGYVDNNSATILGVPVGTLSGEARLAKEQREFELSKMREQSQIEYQNNQALYRLKSDLDTQQSKSLADYEYQLKSKHSSPETTNLNTYKDIINNRFANYDEFSKKYNTSDNTSLYNYIVTEYSAGRMSSSDLANLTAMYNVTTPTNKDIASQERLKYLNSLGQ